MMGNAAPMLSAEKNCCSCDFSCDIVQRQCTFLKSVCTLHNLNTAAKTFSNKICRSISSTRPYLMFHSIKNTPRCFIIDLTMFAAIFADCIASIEANLSDLSIVVPPLCACDSLVARALHGLCCAVLCNKYAPTVVTLHRDTLPLWATTFAATFAALLLTGETYFF